MNAKTKAAKLVERLIRAEHTESMRADARRYDYERRHGRHCNAIDHVPQRPEVPGC